MKVLCILTDMFEDIEAIGTIALLRRAGIQIDVFSLHSNKAIGRFGVEYSNLLNINELKKEDYDCLYIAGGPEYKELESNEYFLNLIKYFYSSNKFIAAICAGPTILGHLGILKKKNYTCFTSMNEDFGGHYLDQYCVRDGKIITGRSAASVIDFSFLIIEALGGKDLSTKIKNQIYY